MSLKYLLNIFKINNIYICQKYYLNSLYYIIIFYMKVIKSKGGYYYKVYKNGKKVRISKEKYLKLKKNNKKVKKKMKGGFSKGNIVCVKSSINNMLRESMIGQIKTKNTNANTLTPYRVDFEPKLNNNSTTYTPMNYLGRHLSSNAMSHLEIITLPATTYIEQYIEPKIRTIIVGSYFWSQWMKPLLEHKKIRVKTLRPLKFSSIREPLFTTSPGANFQDMLTKWWIEVSEDFTKMSKDYCLMKEDVAKELITSRPNNTTQHNSDYFYLQLPVTFINRLLQMIEFYGEILFSNEKLTDYHTTKAKVKANTKENKQMVNYYGTKKYTEPSLVNSYQDELDQFRKIFRTLDIFCQSNGLYTNLLAVELAILDWYITNVSRIKNTLIKNIKNSVYTSQNSTKIIPMLKTHYNESFNKKYVLLPISMDPKEDYMINMYCIPIILYLGKMICVHENNNNESLSHPINQVHHDLLGHMGYQIKEYYYLSENQFLFKKLLEFRTVLIKKVLHMTDFLNELLTQKKHLNVKDKTYNDINKKYINSYLQSIYELEVEIEELESKIKELETNNNSSTYPRQASLKQQLIIKKECKKKSILSVLLFELIHEESIGFTTLSKSIYYSIRELNEKYKEFQTTYPFKLTIYHPILFYNFLLFLWNTYPTMNIKMKLSCLNLFLEIYKNAFRTVFDTDLIEIKINPTVNSSNKGNIIVLNNGLPDIFLFGN
jgi:hypothetical protein